MKLWVSVFALTLVVGLSAPAQAAFQLVAEDVFEKLNASAESNADVKKACASSKSSNACKTAKSKALFSIYQSNTNALINTMNEESFTPEEYKRINDIQGVWIKELTGKTYSEVLVLQKDRLSLVIDLFNAYERKADQSEIKGYFKNIADANYAFEWGSRCNEEGFLAAHQHSVKIIEAFRNRNINYLASITEKTPMKGGPGGQDLSGAKFEDYFTEENRTSVLSTEGKPEQCEPLGYEGTRIADGAMWLEYAPEDWNGKLSVTQINFHIWPPNMRAEPTPTVSSGFGLEPFPRDVGTECFATEWLSSDNYQALAEHFNAGYRVFSHPGEFLSKDPELFTQFAAFDSFISFLRILPSCKNIPNPAEVLNSEQISETIRGEPYNVLRETVKCNDFGFTECSHQVRFLKNLKRKEDCDKYITSENRLTCKAAAYVKVNNNSTASEYALYGLVTLADGREAIMPLRRFDGEAEMRRHMAGKR